MIQLELFPESREDQLSRKIDKIREQSEKIRKSQFAKISSLQKTVDELEARMKIYDQFICRKTDKNDTFQMILPFIDS